MWKDVVGYEEFYEVSDDGKIRNKLTGRVLRQTIKKNGYKQVELRYARAATVSVHRIVAQAFIENPLNYPCVNHINEIKTDNRVENLEWCTHAYNMSYGSREHSRDTPILQYDLNGKLIKEWGSLKTAQESTGILYQCISACCRNKGRTAGGYIWRYKGVARKWGTTKSHQR